MLANYKRGLFVGEREMFGRRAGVAGHKGRAAKASCA